MNLTLLDWTVIALYFPLQFSHWAVLRPAGACSTSEFFLSGRDVPWWAGRHIDGCHDIRSGYAAGRHRHGGGKRNCRQLALVEPRDEPE